MRRALAAFALRGRLRRRRRAALKCVLMPRRDGRDRLAAMRALRTWLEVAAGQPVSVRTAAAVLLGVLRSKAASPRDLTRIRCGPAAADDRGVGAMVARALALLVMRRGEEEVEEAATAGELLQLATRLIERHSGDEGDETAGILTACVVAAADLVRWTRAGERLHRALAGLVTRREVRLVHGTLDAIAAAAGPEDARVLEAATAAMDAAVQRSYGVLCYRRVVSFVAGLSDATQAAFVSDLFRKLQHCSRGSFADAIIADCAGLSGALDAALESNLMNWFVSRAGAGRSIHGLPALLRGPGRRATHRQLAKAGELWAHLSLQCFAGTDSACAEALWDMIEVGRESWVAAHRVLLRFGGAEVRKAGATLADLGIGMEAAVDFVDVWDTDYQWWRSCRGGGSSFAKLTVTVRWSGRTVAVELPGDGTALDLACSAAAALEQYGYRPPSSAGRNLYIEDIQRHFPGTAPLRARPGRDGCAPPKPPPPGAGLRDIAADLAAVGRRAALAL